MAKEIWKDIPCYEGIYQVSNKGRVKSLDRIVVRKDGACFRLKGKILNLTKNTYLYVRLCVNGKDKHYAVHRLVCECFHSNPDNLPCVNHKDNNPLNNQVDNLEWCTYSYNNNYGSHSERLSDSMVEKYGVAVDVYTKYGEFIQTYNSIRDAVNDGYTRDSISKCCRGELNSHRNVVFCYHGDSFVFNNRKGNVKVEKYNKEGILIDTYNTISEAAKCNDLKKDKLLYMKNNKITTDVGGFFYRFIV